MNEQQVDDLIEKALDEIMWNKPERNSDGSMKLRGRDMFNQPSVAARLKKKKHDRNVVDRDDKTKV